MKLKKTFGKIMLSLTKIISTSAPASTFSIGVEEMPESMKRNR